MIKQGLIVSSYGRQFIVRIDSKDYQAVTKSKKTDYVVGDLVNANYINEEQVQILDCTSRSSLIYRSDHNRTKIIASNVNQILIVIAIKPTFNPQFLNRCLVCAEAEKITPIIIINKSDLLESKNFITKITSLYQLKLGYNVITLEAQKDCEKLLPLLEQKNSLLIGQSGVGKSTIINQIVPRANARIGEITKAQTSGSHTTTNATYYQINKSSSIIDSPGMQEFGLNHLNVTDVIEYFPEFRNYNGTCKFRNCSHNSEPGCNIKEGFDSGKFDNNRVDLFKLLIQELTMKRSY